MVMGKENRFSPEVKERAVRLVYEQQKELESQWAAIRSVALKIGCSPETLRHWIRKDEVDTGKREGRTSNERERMKQLEKENRELKKANEILRLASAFFAKAELDRQLR
jgi:transposase-like protein